MPRWTQCAHLQTKMKLSYAQMLCSSSSWRSCKSSQDLLQVLFGRFFPASASSPPRPRRRLSREVKLLEGSVGTLCSSEIASSDMTDGSSGPTEISPRALIRLGRTLALIRLGRALNLTPFFFMTKRRRTSGIQSWSLFRHASHSRTHRSSQLWWTTVA